MEEKSVTDFGTYCNVHCSVDVIKGTPATVAFRASAQLARAFLATRRLGSKVNVSIIFTANGTEMLKI